MNVSFGQVESGTAYNVIPAQERELLIFNDIKHYTYTEQELARENWLIEQLKK